LRRAFWRLKNRRLAVTGVAFDRHELALCIAHYFNQAVLFFHLNAVDRLEDLCLRMLASSFWVLPPRAPIQTGWPKKLKFILTRCRFFSKFFRREYNLSQFHEIARA
jgi:hypothetical protein